MHQNLRIGIGALLLAGLVGIGALPGRAEDKLININSATAEELATLKGVGEAKARAIVTHREKNGPFKSVDDLDQVSGIGEKLMGSLRSQITIGSGHPQAAGTGPGRAAH